MGGAGTARNGHSRPESRSAPAYIGGVVMPDSDRRPTSMRFAALVLIGLTGAFVTALIATTGQLILLWPLYVIPIVIAALTYRVAGAVMATALAAAIVALSLYGGGAETPVLGELVVGFAAFAISGLVIGVQAQRHGRHELLLENASILDQPTGVHKREYLLRRLAKEISRSERHHLYCSLLLAEVACFNEFKERFGHYKADMLLEHLGQVLRMSVRDGDIVGRVDTATFGIVLVQTGAAGARNVAERLRRTVAATEFEGDVLEPATRCAVWVATATYPVDGCESHALLKGASQGLREAESS